MAIEPEANSDAQPLDDDALDAATGGCMDNSTTVIFENTFVPFDSSF